MLNSHLSLQRFHLVCIGQSLFYRMVRLRLVKWLAQNHSKNKIGLVFDPSSDWAQVPGKCLTNTTPWISAWIMLSESSRDYFKTLLCKDSASQGVGFWVSVSWRFHQWPWCSIRQPWQWLNSVNMPSLVYCLFVELLNKDLMPTVFEPIVGSGRWMCTQPSLRKMPCSKYRGSVLIWSSCFNKILQSG